MGFQVSDSLLENDFIQINEKFKMKVPSNWIENKTLIEPLQTRLKTANPYELYLQNCFVDEKSQAVLLISSIEKLNDNQYESMISKLKTVKTKNSSYFQYKHNDVIFDQIVTQDSISVNLKLIVYKDALMKFQLDFIVPVQKYPIISKKIESCIGSITRII